MVAGFGFLCGGEGRGAREAGVQSHGQWMKLAIPSPSSLFGGLLSADGGSRRPLAPFYRRLRCCGLLALKAGNSSALPSSRGGAAAAVAAAAEAALVVSMMVVVVVLLVLVVLVVLMMAALGCRAVN